MYHRIELFLKNSIHIKNAKDFVYITQLVVNVSQFSLNETLKYKVLYFYFSKYSDVDSYNVIIRFFNFYKKIGNRIFFNRQANILKKQLYSEINCVNFLSHNIELKRYYFKH